MNHQSLVVWRQVKNFYLSIFSLIVNVKIAQLFFADIYVLSSVFFIIRAHSIECHKTKTEESERLTRKKPQEATEYVFNDLSNWSQAISLRLELIKNCTFE